MEKPPGRCQPNQGAKPYDALIFRPEAFAGARLKIERAHEHVRDAERWINAFIDMNIYRISFEVNPDTGENFIRFSGTWINPPGSLSTIIGDAVHNLRTSLDYVATEIRRAGGLDVERGYFPIDDRRESLVYPDSGKIWPGGLCNAGKARFSAVHERIDSLA